jgi:O-antigen biosynthesis protein
LKRHLQRIGADADVQDTGNELRIRYRLPTTPPTVTLIVPTRNAVALLRQCIESVVLDTAYPDFDILVIDNGSNDPAALAYLRELNAAPGIEVIRDEGPFNYAALNNRAVARARGDVVALVNNDVEVCSPGWLEEMVSLALQPGVGAVGAKLLFADETVQHGGVLLGVGGIAGHAHKHVPAWHPGYFQRAQSVQSMSAVTAACLVVQKRLYQEVGGLDEQHLKVAFNDIDFCLKLQAAGYRNVWTPHAVLFHHESATRGQEVSDAQRARLAEEELYMRQRWSDLIANDPAYNPNLTIHAENFGLAWPPRVPWIQGAARP